MGRLWNKKKRKVSMSGDGKEEEQEEGRIGDKRRPRRRGATTTREDRGQKPTALRFDCDSKHLLLTGRRKGGCSFFPQRPKANDLHSDAYSLRDRHVWHRRTRRSQARGASVRTTLQAAEEHGANSGCQMRGSAAGASRWGNPAGCRASNR